MCFLLVSKAASLEESGLNIQQTFEISVKYYFIYTPVNFCQISRIPIAEHSIVHIQLRKNIKSCRIDGSNVNKASLRPISEVCHVGIIDSILKGSEIEVRLVHYVYIKYYQKTVRSGFILQYNTF